MPEISVINPIGRAWDRMQVICFRPFNFTRWLMLGFCAWLAYLGEGGAGFNFPGGGSGGRGGGGTRGRPFPVEPASPVAQALAWIQQHLVLVTGIVVAALVLGTAIYLVLHWLRARGEFMFLDGIATNRQDDLIARPWKQFSRQANSFFIFQASMGLVNIAVFLLISALCLWIAWPDLYAWEFTHRGIAAILAAICMFPTAMILLGTIILCNRMFVAPIMYVRECMFWPAWCEFWKVIVPGHVWSLTLMFTMYALLAMAVGIVVMLGTCLTCCLAALPYVSSVVFLPALVFLRCYSICYLEQFGSQYVMLSYESAPPGFEVIMPPSPAALPAPPPVPPAL